jgi:hypothetical protein
MFTIKDVLLQYYPIHYIRFSQMGAHWMNFCKNSFASTAMQTHAAHHCYLAL